MNVNKVTELLESRARPSPITKFNSVYFYSPGGTGVLGNILPSYSTSTQVTVQPRVRDAALAIQPQIASVFVYQQVMGVDPPDVVVSQKLVSGKVNRANLAFSSSDVYCFCV